MNKVLSKIELIANLAIIAVAIALGAVLIKHFVSTNEGSKSHATRHANVGDRFSLADVDWARNESSLVLVLSDRCKYCTESASFYQRIAQERKEQNGFRLIAVFPQTVDDGQKYLKALDVSVDEVRQAPLGTLGVEGTPTLLLVNKVGVLTNIWIGKLPVEKEKEVLDRVRS